MANVQPFHARKRFGQHFLHDPAVIQRIVSAIAVKPGQTIVEIGPGLGALTAPLLALTEYLHVVELDRDLARRLAVEFQGQNLHLHTADALTFDFSALMRPDRPLRIVGNLPYNISTPLLFHLLAQSQYIRDMHFMFQREVANRIVALPGDAHYGRLSVMTQWHCITEKLFDIGPGAFVPPPRVTSSIVRLAVRTAPPAPVLDRNILERVVVKAFTHRRKTLRNSLREWLTPAEIMAAGVDPAARPETLNLHQFANLSNRIAACS
uniref:Ribosomal RNA small subunit methyltransferase A n=1 Tax=Candidatus Kentrum sp. TUN TaxID=2126343 RepID=A0A451A5R8_9GAMM|nr:MAG: 16S rRNA (adenine1518-N6/adenine1519-N6)-dimethyltransferase [Candidatus Kentron sp. TUN]VFK61374.1 MAG: 16S rRNA (adenine1518-N6/adenine1519-N6)-dimethyltransferase [Candidatus Kentron sp. TUN]VFK67802.1 MAG: 16S rRNA (adenine1518-N6/adenine1519-N6)-dimethyltransferase [Candidatus Kentron sp. TUN]